MVTASWELALSGLLIGAGVALFFRHALMKEEDASTSQSSLKEWKESAHKGNAKAQYHVGYLYEMGIDAPKKPSKGFYWYCRAAANGHRGATAKVARCYLDGIGVEEDLDEGLWWMSPGHASAKRKRAKTICAKREGEFKASDVKNSSETIHF